MEEKYIDILKEFFADLQQPYIQNLYETSVEYRNYRYVYSEEIEKYEQIISTLSSDEQKFISDHIENIYVLCYLEQEWMYIKGYLDCSELLNNFNLL